ncbi:hypothetical protein Agub_g11856 [Astrephomene gubernaculifera]|uniref:Spindle and kinetochore-associated protein 3 n=1 Tax=Astrephomene gubernaculifera TaxID=47775 RepID=A0AAD3DX72_9CHLO|nr:hypothetical protein Agub_g11856 [Astrephomene gubernaculifera]
MAPKRRTLRSAVARFADDLRSVTQQLNDSVTFLSRATQHKPCVGPREFRQVLSDLQDEVSDLTTEVENLERFTVDTISFEELLGHCVGLYQANRSTIQLLEEHLQQYGYQQPPGVVQEPENPVSAAAVAAVKARRAGDGNRRDGAIDNEDEEDCIGLGAPSVGIRSALAKAPSINVAGPSKSMRSLGHNKEGKHVVMMTPGDALAAEPKRHNLRKATPGSKLGTNSMDCSSDEDGARHGDEDSAGGCSDDELEERALNQQRMVTHAAAGTSFAKPTGSLASKGNLLAAAQASSYTSALNVAASARKAPRPSVDSHASNTPEPMLLSPSMAELLAKYNPPSGSSPVPPPAAMAADPVAPRSGDALVSDELVTSMHNMAPFGRKEALPAPDLQPKLPSRAPVAAPTVAAVEAPKPAPLASVAQQPPSQEFRRPPADEDTCVLYKQLIRSQHVPSSLVPPRPRQLPPKPEPAEPVPQPQPTQAPRSMSFPGAPMASASPSKGPVPDGASGATDGTPPPMTARARSVTPRSVQRTQFQAHDKLLNEKFEGLTERLSGLKQAWGQSPVRRSLIQNNDAGIAANVAGPSAAALMNLRAKSPGPSRAALEAAAAAEAILAGPPAAVDAKPAAPATAAFVAPQQQLRQQDALQPRQAYSRADPVPEPADCGRVLSQVQQVSSNDAQPMNTPSRASRVSRLPLPTASPEPTTVVGVAVTTPRHENTHAGDVNGRAAPTTTPKRAGALAQRGTPGRVPRPVPSNSNTSSTGAGVNPLKGPQKTSSPILPSSRDNGAATPSRVTRGVAAGAGAAPLSARASRLTPPHRQSCAAVLPGMAAAAAAAVAEAEASAVTPRAGRAVAGASNRTPGRVPVPDARNAGFKATEALPPSGLSQLQAKAGVRADACGNGGAKPDGSWQGFPLSRRAPEGDQQASARFAPARRSDDVTLGMPPAVPQSPGAQGGVQSPRGSTPGRGIPSSSVATSIACPAAVAATTTVTPGLSPTTTRMVSRALGEGFMGQIRPSSAAVGNLSSRIPVPASGPLGRPPTAGPCPVPSTSPGPRSGIGGGSGALTSRLPSAAAPAEAAAAVAAAAATPLPCEVELCSEEEWRGLPARTQQAFRLEVLNQHLRSLAQVVASRPPDTGSDRCFSVADVEALSLTTLSAKLLINTLVKLGRCDVASAAAAGAMMYRLRA